MNIHDVRDIISSAFSAAGFTQDSYTVNLSSPTTVHLYGDSDSLHVIFAPKTLPTMSVQKIIKLSVNLEEIYVDSKGGKIKLKNFPDINFRFDASSDGEPHCGASHPPILGTDLLDEVDAKYGGDPARRKIARKVLQYAHAWAIMSVEGGTSFAGFDEGARRDAVNQCVDFVTEQMRADPDVRHGSVLIIMLVQLILPYIIKWIVERMIDRLING